MKDLTIIAAISENNVIGVEGKLPWKIPEDLQHFKELTMGSTIVMGRKTFESIRRPLPGRENIILTKNLDYQEPEILVAHTIKEAVEKATRESIYVIGGQEVYREALATANKMELTRVHANYYGDAFFPEVDYSQWQLTKEVNKEGFSFLSYSRK